MKTLYSRFVSHLLVFGILVSSSNVLIANMKTMNGLDDAPPTNPVHTNRFPSVYSSPVSAPTPKAKIRPGGTTGAEPSASPSP